MKKYFKVIFSAIALFTICAFTACTPNLYTISFETNGGQPEIEDQIILVGETLPEINVPTKEGYNFAGWYLDEGLTQRFDITTKINNSFTLYAKWDVKSYAIFFNSNGGTAVTTANYNYGSALTKPEDPVKTGYGFEGWYIDQELTNKFDWSSTMPANDLTLYANWEANKFAVKYVSNNVEIEELQQMVSYNTATTAPENPVRTGYTFGGWLLDGAPFDFNTILTKSITLTAKWTINSYTISYNTNGGTEIDSVVYEYGKTVVRPEAPTKTGYKFVGWKLNDEVFSFDNYSMPAQDIELEAVWTVNDYVISYNKNNSLASGTTSNTEAKYDQTVTIAANGYILTGYTFTGWNTKADGTGTAYAVGTEVKSLATSGIVELFAQWSANDYTVTFNSNGGTEVEGLTLNYNNVIAKPTNPEKTGYTFSYWALNGTAFDFTNTLMPAENIVLEAVWVVNEYTISYNNNNDKATGTTANTVTEYDKEVTIAANGYILTGYTFTGWNTKADGTGTAYAAGTTVKSLATSGIVELFAQWSANEYEISFDANSNGVEGQMETIAVEFDTTIDLPQNVFTKVGYTFQGWSTTANGIVSYSDNAKYQVSNAKNVTLYAVWKANPYTITFDSNTGEGEMSVMSATYDKGANLTLNTFTKMGNKFLGWATEANGEVVYTDGQTVNNLVAEGNVTLYAVWEKIEYTFTVYVTSENYKEYKYHYGDVIEAVEDAQVEGKTFECWLNAETNEKFGFDGATMPAKGMAIYPKWYAEYTINFVTGFDDVIIPAISGIIGSDYTLAQPTKEGYTFNGWYNKELTTKYELNGEMPEDGFTAYAKWTINQYEVTYLEADGTEIKKELLDFNSNFTPATKEGYTFVNWCLDAELQVLATKVPAEAITVYAKWDANEYVIKYTDSINGTINQEATFGNTITLANSGFDKTGYTLTSWNTKADGSGTSYELGEVVSNLVTSGEITLYAQFTANTYSINFDTNSTGVEGEMNTQIVTYDVETELSLNSFTKKGYTFQGWATSATGAVKYTNGQKVINLLTSGEITLYAVWEINKYTVIINVDGTETENKNVNYGTALYEIVNVSTNKEGYTFSGWLINEELVTDITTIKVENNLTLKAVFTPNEYTVKFDANNGEGEMLDQTLTYDQEDNLSPNQFVRVGYTFQGWALSATGAVKYTNGQKVENLTTSGEYTLYAVWEINTYNITYTVDGETTEVNDVEYGTLISTVLPTLNKVGHSYVWTINDNEININEYIISSEIDVVAKFTKNIYTVSFVVNNKEVYTVQREYGAELLFSEYINILKTKFELIADFEKGLEKLSVEDMSVIGKYIGTTEYSEKLKTYFKTIYDEWEIAQKSGFEFSQLGKVTTLTNTERQNYESLYSSYLQNDGNPSLDGAIFGGWVLGEDTLYEELATGNTYEGYVPASKNINEKAYIIASFAGVDEIDDIEVDKADNTKIHWTGVDTSSLGFSADYFNIDVEYELYNCINDNEMALIDSVKNQTYYHFLQPDTYNVPGKYYFKIKAIVTVTDKETGNIHTVLSSTFADESFEYLLSMSQNNLAVDASGDYYYRGTDENTDLTTFYFYTNMTYDFSTTNFVLTDEAGNVVDPSTYANTVSVVTGSTGNNSVFKTTKNQGNFYFKTNPTESRVYFAKVLPYVASFSLGKELTNYTSVKNGTGLFLNEENSVYQIGVANPSYNIGTKTANYDNNGFEFRLDIKTSGGEKIEYHNMSDFIEYKFYRLDGEEWTSVLNDEMGVYTSNFAWEFNSSLSGIYKVEISIKNIYVAPKLINDGIIKPIEFIFNLNDRVNVYTHEVLKTVYGNTSADFRKGINIHSNITATVSDEQRYTDAFYQSDNLLSNGESARDGSLVNIGMSTLMSLAKRYGRNDFITKYNGSVYSRISGTDLEENYIVSGNLFTIDGKKLPYSSIESAGNLSGVNGYKIANQQAAIFLYGVANYSSAEGTQRDFEQTSNSTLNLNDLTIYGNTTVPSLNSSSDAELESSLDIMNRNSGGLLGVYIGTGSHLAVNNSVINNTTIALKGEYGLSNMNIDYFYSDSSWANTIFAQFAGQVNISNSLLKNSGGAAIHLEDGVSTTTTPTPGKVRIDKNTIIDNFVSGEEGYFKAYSLEFAVMQMKASMESGVNPYGFTMIKTFVDPISGLETSKVNFVFLSLPVHQNRNGSEITYTYNGTTVSGAGARTSKYQVELYDAIASAYAGQDVYYTYNYDNYISNTTGNPIPMNFMKLNGQNPAEGVLMSANQIPGMGNAFIIASVYAKGE